VTHNDGAHPAPSIQGCDGHQTGDCDTDSRGPGHGCGRARPVAATINLRRMHQINIQPTAIASEVLFTRNRGEARQTLRPHIRPPLQQ